LGFGNGIRGGVGRGQAVNKIAESVREFAPAKVNLGLAVTGKLENGYHALDTLFVTCDVGDVVTLKAIPEGIELEVIGSDLPTTRDNLVYRAAEAYLERANISGGVRLKLEKNLPIAAGLGGGSSDAAACLRGMRRLYPSDLDLLEIAKDLGADVPFLIYGGAARGSGVGEILELVELPELHLVLANPGVGITAKEAYIGLRGRFGAPLEFAAMLEAFERGEAPPYRNDLELPVIEAYPVVQTVKNALARAGLTGVLMSGSGSTCYGLARDRDHALECAERVALEHPTWWVRATQTI
jgi:4-diphosphocytidyl-2-C-methyl-D-erythritol kinase